MCIDNEEYSFEEIVLFEQQNFYAVFLDGFGLYSVDNIEDYKKNKKRFEKIGESEINRLMNEQLEYYLECGYLQNWQKYFEDSIKKRLNDGEPLDIKFFSLTYQILNMTIQENTCYPDEGQLLEYKI